MALTANTRPIDDIRAARIALAWATNDAMGFHLVMEEAMEDEIAGTPGLVVALTEFAARSITTIDPDGYAGQLRHQIAELSLLNNEDNDDFTQMGDENN